MLRFMKNFSVLKKGIKCILDTLRQTLICVFNAKSVQMVRYFQNDRRSIAVRYGTIGYGTLETSDKTGLPYCFTKYFFKFNFFSYQSKSTLQMLLAIIFFDSQCGFYIENKVAVLGIVSKVKSVKNEFFLKYFCIFVIYTKSYLNPEIFKKIGCLFQKLRFAWVTLQDHKTVSG